jgi:hypothetical protein
MLTLIDAPLLRRPLTVVILPLVYKIRAPASSQASQIFAREMGDILQLHDLIYVAQRTTCTRALGSNDDPMAPGSDIVTLLPKSYCHSDPLHCALARHDCKYHAHRAN